MPKKILQEKILLEETQAAWRELVCLQSWYNEVSSRHERYEELVYRLLAAEKWYQSCLHRLQEAGITKLPAPYSSLDKRRNVNLNGCWYGW